MRPEILYHVVDRRLTGREDVILCDVDLHRREPLHHPAGAGAAVGQTGKTDPFAFEHLEEFHRSGDGMIDVVDGSIEVEQHRVDAFVEQAEQLFTWHLPRPLQMRDFSAPQ